MTFELGEKRMVDSGLSSPNWDPRLVKVYAISVYHKRDRYQTHLQLVEDLFPDTDDLAQW